MTDNIEQVVLLSDMTSSKTGSFYLAYGSNLSPTQMGLRLRQDPKYMKPVGIVRLDAYSWIICERGYANVVALSPTEAADDSTTVWGILYNLSAEDEAKLDKFEGHNEERNPKPEINPDPSQQQMRPYLQGEWDYNKHYLPMTVTKWLADPNQFGVNAPEWEEQRPVSVRGLVYVDETRTKPGKITQEYIGRMNRAIRESIELGMPEEWVNKVMRQHIPAGIEVVHEGYVGRANGFVEAEATETASELEERVMKEMTNRQIEVLA